MENFRKIELYKSRDFSDKLNATFAFLRQNSLAFLKAQLAISGPMALLATFLYYLLISDLTDAAYLGNSSDYIFSAQYFSTLGSTILIYFLMGLSIWLVSFSYLRLYQENDGEKPSVRQVFHVVISKLGPGVVAMVMIYLLVSIGMILLFFPGIYLGVICTLIFPIMVLEDVSPFKALERAFKLIQGKWWSTLGLLVVNGIIAYIIMVVLVLPTTAFTVIASLFADENEALNWMQGDSLAIVATLGSLLNYLGMIIGGTLVQLGLGFQYGNLIEAKESKGLLMEIEQMGAEENSDNDEGEY